MIDQKKTTFSTSEVLPDLRISALFEETQINSALGFGLVYQPPQSSFNFGVQTIFDFQQPISVTVQSVPFPSAFYNVNTGRQVNTTVVVTASAPIEFATLFGTAFQTRAKPR